MASRYAANQAADDIAQEAALRAWRRRSSCRDPSRPWAWLAQITRNEAIRHAARHPEELARDDDTAEPVAENESLEDRMMLQDAVATLGALDRVLVRLYYESDLSVAAVGELVGMAPGAVKVRLHRARAALRSMLEADDRSPT